MAVTSNLLVGQGRVRALLLATPIVLLSASPLLAQSVMEQSILQLEAQGYEIVESERTFLGRIRIVARNAGGEREIVLDRSSGAILRDYFEPNQVVQTVIPTVRTVGSAASQGNPGDNGSSGNGGSDDSANGNSGGNGNGSENSNGGNSGGENSGGANGNGGSASESRGDNRSDAANDAPGRNR